MSFSQWKKRSTAINDYIPEGYRAMAERVAKAAYKAGERDGRKQVESLIDASFAFSDLIKGKK